MLLLTAQIVRFDILFGLGPFLSLMGLKYMDVVL
jgi:hypothetical protein